MHTDQLDYLVEISKSRSLSEASRTLHLTVQALSMSVKALEEELEIELLARSYQGITFTEKGRRLVKLYQQFHQDVQELVLWDQPESDQTLTGDLIVLVNYCGVVGFLPQFICGFDLHAPNLKVVVRETAILDILQQVSSEEAEFGLTYHFLPTVGIDLRAYEMLQFVPLFQAKMICQVNKYSPLAKRRKITLNEALSYPSVVYQPVENSPTSLLDILQPFEDTQQVMVTHSSNLYHEMIVNNDRVGFSVIVPHGVQTNLYEGEVFSILISDNIKGEYGYVVKKGVPLSKNAQVFLEDLLEESHKKPNFSGSKL